MNSRSAHKPRACATVCASAASVAFDGLLRNCLQQRRRVRVALVVAQLQQRVVGRTAGQRRAVRREVALDQLQAQVGEQLEARQRRSGHRLCDVQHRQRRLHRADREQRRCLAPRRRKGLEAGGGDHAERAFGADEEVAQVVARVVLAQSAQAVPQFARRQHDLEPEGELARVAVAQDLRAAGVGRQVAADGGRALRRQRQRKQASRRGGGFLHALQRAARFDGDRVVDRVDGAHAIHAAQRQQDRAAAVVRRAAADQAGVAALRHDRRARLHAQLHDGGDFRCRGRPHDGLRAAGVALAPVGEIRRRVRGLGQHVGCADRRLQLLEQGHGAALRARAARFSGRR
jgi:hypothetical protein